MTVEAKINYYSLRLYIEGILALHIRRRKYIGFHAWTDGNERYCIEFHTGKKNILTEWDNIDKWKAILKELDDKLN
jgi:hypothetical protein